MSARPATYDHLRSQKKAITTKVVISLDNEVADQFSEAQAERERAQIRLRARPEDPDVVERHEKAEAEYQRLRALMEEESVEFVLRSLGRKKFEKILLAHAPSDEQVKAARSKGLDPPNWNGDTFPVALVAACLVSPELTPEQVQELWDDDNWSGAETTELFMAALNVNTTRRQVNLGKG